MANENDVVFQACRAMLRARGWVRRDFLWMERWRDPVTGRRVSLMRALELDDARRCQEQIDARLRAYTCLPSGK